MKTYDISNQNSHNYDAPKDKAKIQSRERVYQKDIRDQEIAELKLQNTKLRKQLKQTQAKRTQITKECSNVIKKFEQIENENYHLTKQVKDALQRNDGEKYRIQELKFLNKQLNNQIEELRLENQSLNEKLRYSSEILQRKYQELEQRTYKRMQQAMKRIKKSILYLESLSPKEIQKTKEVLVESLAKSIQLLKGKQSEESCEQEIQEFMNPLKVLQQNNHQKSKDNTRLRQENVKLQEQIRKHKKVERQLLPQYKQAIDKLKKNLGQVRSQLAENEYDRNQMKKKHIEKLKQTEHKYNQLFKDYRKVQVENKIYQNKLVELEEDVEEEKQRLMGQNQMLKRLYRTQSQDSSYSLKASGLNQFKSIDQNKQIHKSRQKNIHPDKKFLRKNYSSNQLKASTMKPASSLYGSRKKLQLSGFGPNEESSMLSQQSLKNQIHKIDREIVEIQEKLTQELDMYN